MIYEKGERTYSELSTIAINDVPFQEIENSVVEGLEIKDI